MTQDWRDRDTLYRLYWEEGLTQPEIAERLGCSGATISNWMAKHEIPKRGDYSVVFGFDGDGYPYVRDEGKVVRVHRLVAVAKCGYGDVAGNDVHHKNGVPWDNRPSNLDVLSPGEHRSIHGKERELAWADDGQFVSPDL